ncbi:MAG: FAD-dependent monooxygenase [Gammaproteobacteria bacterium]|nr:FAD-dependent monooxygenase [Gammaproteobacteria bacterium]
MKVSIVGGGPGGLYFAILAKKAWPDWDIAVYERNRPDDTFGFGVVFSDETLGFLNDYDSPSYEAIRRRFAYWDDVDIHYDEEVLRSAGNGFCGCSRLTLLQLLQQRAEELGVDVRFEVEVTDAAQFADSDLIVAADGIASVIRDQRKEAFGTDVQLMNNYFCWLGSTRELDAFKYFFRMTKHGPMVMHSYQYEPGMSTWIAELPAATMEKSGFLEQSEEQYVAELERLYNRELEGHRLITNRSIWRQFPRVKNASWVDGNIVLIGDAQHTAHFSIGSGTKLAMESSIALFEAFRKTHVVDDALQLFEETRRDPVEITQHAAEVSLAWFENLFDHWGQPLEQFAFGVMSRSKQITYENLMLRDASFVEKCDRRFEQHIADSGLRKPPGAPPMFATLRLRDMELENRVSVSSMAQYSAVDGNLTPWHRIHYSKFATGGAGLVCTEMTCPSPQGRITPGCTGLWNEQQAEDWREIVDFTHDNSPAKICMQIGHSGRKGSTKLGWEGIDQPLDEGNWPVVSASPLKYLDVSQTPEELSEEQMSRIVDEFARSVALAEMAGFDMIEAHCAHGYLLASFISPLTNKRSDRFGGSIENRMRFPLAVIERMRKEWPQHKPLSARLSATDWAPGGLSEEDLIAACHMLKRAGVDIINVSTGQTVSFEEPVYGRMYQVPFSDKVRHRVDIPTTVAGNIYTADQVNTILMAGRADLIALARPHLTNPNFTLDAGAWYGVEQDAIWPKQYHSAMFQAVRLGEKDRQEWNDMKRALKPPTHEVKQEER